MNDGPALVYASGQNWYEAPGCHHSICDNPSNTEPAELLATFVIETEVLKGGYDILTQIDPGY